MSLRYLVTSGILISHHTFQMLVRLSIITRSKGNSQTTSERVEMEPTVIYEEITPCQMVVSNEIAVQENSAYGLVSH